MEWRRKNFNLGKELLLGKEIETVFAGWVVVVFYFVFWFGLDSKKHSQ